MMLPGNEVLPPRWMRIACGTAWNQETVWMMKKASAISDRMTTIGCLTKAMKPAQGVRPAAELEQAIDQQRHVEADEQRADLVQHVTLVAGVAEEPGRLRHRPLVRPAGAHFLPPIPAMQVR